MVAFVCLQCDGPERLPRKPCDATAANVASVETGDQSLEKASLSALRTAEQMMAATSTFRARSTTVKASDNRRPRFGRRWFHFNASLF